MILDDQLKFSDAQALTTTANSTNIVDIGAAGAPISPGIRFRVDETTTLAAGTSLRITLTTSANSDMSSSVTIVDTGVVTTANLPTPLVDVEVPPADLRRYNRVTYTIAGTYNAGAVDAHLAMNTPIGNA